MALCLPLCGAAGADAGVEAGADRPLLRVALLQMAPTGGGQDAQRDKALAFCREAKAQGADIALMPEMWSLGYPTPGPIGDGARARFMQEAHGPDSPWLGAFAALAKELDMAIGVTYTQAWPDAPRNVITLYDRHGREALTYAKVHTCDWNPLEAATTPGDAFPVATLDTRHGPVRVGAMICYDREHPESARLLMIHGAEVVLVPNASKLDDLRVEQFRIRAWENCMGVAMANYAGPKNNGRSVAFDAKGRQLVIAREREGVYTAQFDLDALRAERADTIWGGAYRRPHRYEGITRPAEDPVWKRRTFTGGDYDPAQR
jgi:predicted amidohydrolase